MVIHKHPTWWAFMLLVGLSGCYEYHPPYLAANFDDYQKHYHEKDLAFMESGNLLTLTAAMELAVKNNPDYIAAFHAVNAAKFRYYQSIGAYLPRVDGTFAVGQNIQQNDNLENPQADMAPHAREFTTSTTVTASYLVFDGLARELACIIAQKEFSRSKQLDANTRRLLLRAVAYAYNDVRLAIENERIALADLAFQDSSLLQSENRYKNGWVPLSDVLNFKILGSRARSNLYNARYQKKIALYALATLMGYPAGILPDGLRFSSLDAAVPEMVIDLPGCIDLALANRPDLRAYRELWRIATLQKYRNWSPFLPTVWFQTGYALNTSDTRYRSHDVNMSYYNQNLFQYGVSANVNLFDGFRTVNKIRESEAEQARAGYILEKSFLECVSDVESAYANYRNCVDQSVIFRDMLKWVFQQRQLVRTEYLGGKETITRLNGAQRDLISAESELAIALVELNKARAQLEAAINAPLPVTPRYYPELDSNTPLERLLESLDRKFPY